MSQDRSHTLKTYSLADVGLENQHRSNYKTYTVDELIAELRADRDSLRDALAAALAWWEEARNEARGSHPTGMIGVEADDFARCGAVLGGKRA